MNLLQIDGIPCLKANNYTLEEGEQSVVQPRAQECASFSLHSTAPQHAAGNQWTMAHCRAHFLPASMQPPTTRGPDTKRCNFYGCMARVLNKHCRAVCAEEAYFAPKREHQGSGWVKHEQKSQGGSAPRRTGVANAAEQVPYWPDQAL